MGRPRIKINWEDVEKLCILQCLQREVAWFCNVSLDTIERACKREKKQSFAEYYSQKKSVGRISLRRAQWEVAVKQKNVTMLIWLGKQYLKQSDKFEGIDRDELGFEFVEDEEAK